MESSLPQLLLFHQTRGEPQENVDQGKLMTAVLPILVNSQQEEIHKKLIQILPKYSENLERKKYCFPITRSNESNQTHKLQKQSGDILESPLAQ